MIKNNFNFNRGRLVLLFLIAAIVVFPFGFSNAYASSIGKVISLSGEVFIERQSSVIQIKESFTVELGDIVLTKLNSSVHILFADNTIFAVGADSKVLINKYVYSPDSSKDSALDAKVDKGLLRVMTGKIVSKNPDSFQVRTPKVILGIRGTALFVKVDGDAETMGLLYVSPGHSMRVSIPEAAKEVTMRKPMTKLQLEKQPDESDDESAENDGTGTKVSKVNSVEELSSEDAESVLSETSTDGGTKGLGTDESGAFDSDQAIDPAESGLFEDLKNLKDELSTDDFIDSDQMPDPDDSGDDTDANVIIDIIN